MARRRSSASRSTTLAQQVDTHPHPKLDKEIARVETNAEHAKKEIDRRLDDLDREAGRAETWNYYAVYGSPGSALFSKSGQSYAAIVG